MIAGEILKDVLTPSDFLIGIVTNAIMRCN